MPAVALAALSLAGLGCSSEGADGDGATDGGVTGDSTAAQPTQAAPTTAEVRPVALGEPSETYAEARNWLCRPDLADDACDVDLDATLVNADGSVELEPFRPAEDPVADCFCVYPTISGDPGENSDLEPDAAELGIARSQAARFAQTCDVYAPMYRQIPLGALSSRLSGASGERGGVLGGDPGEVAYGDVREAFMHYMAEFNHGRPVVLVGHSQGAAHLTRLMAEEIDTDDELRSRLLSAMLIGTSVAVGGGDSFQHIAPCESTTDTGCVVSYATFYAGEPPPDDSLFGRVFGESAGHALCTNPVDPAATEPLPLQTYVPAGSAASTVPVDTPFVHYDGLLTGGCRAENGIDWLEVANTSAGAPAWPSDLGGRLSPQWGTHLMDVNFALGDLIALVKTQAGAY